MKKMTEARREAILAAAKTLFEEVGFEQATMSELTARQGGSKATLYRYFNSKEALFQELLQRSAREHSGAMFAMLHPCGGSGNELPPDAMEALALLNPEQDVTSTLKVFAERGLKTFQSLRRIATRRILIAAASNAEVGTQFYEHGPRRGMQMLARYFEGVMNAGQLRRADPWVAACHFRALVESEVDEPGLFNARPDLTDEQIHATVARAVDIFMRAYGPA
ncbi:MAG: TetR/AcrR family transcriptional regulator [Rhodocyclaceae bacterium]|nr:TetR/AcrR family transcriptional regulator [Rhodocyclaceae bacterium]